MNNPKLSLLQPTPLKAFCAPTSEVADLGDACHLGRYVELLPGQILKCRPPLEVEQDAAGQQFFFGKPGAEFNLDYEFSSTYLAALPQARLVGPAYVVVSHDRQVIDESYSGDSILQSSCHFLKRTLKVELDGQTQTLPFILFRPKAEPKSIEAACVLPTHYWHFNYHHWLIECLPRLRCALEFPELATCPVIVPSNLASFQQASLDLLGLKPERLLKFAGGDWGIKKLYFPSVGNFCPAEITWVREKCLAAVDTSRREGATGLYYISRADAKERRLTNEAEVTAYLKTQGFEILCLSGLPFSRQVELFATARLIIGPHGSGLTNMVFAPRDLTLVELMPNDQVNHCFWLLANVLGQSYTFLVGQVVSAQRDFVVSLPQLQRLLTKIL